MLLHSVGVFSSLAISASSHIWKIYFRGIPRTWWNCIFNIHFENGWRGCVRLAEAFWYQWSENKVTVPKNQILFRKQILCRISIKSPLTPTSICWELHTSWMYPCLSGKLHSEFWLLLRVLHRWVWRLVCTLGEADRCSRSNASTHCRVNLCATLFLRRTSFYRFSTGRTGGVELSSHCPGGRLPPQVAHCGSPSCTPA